MNQNQKAVDRMDNQIKDNAEMSNNSLVMTPNNSTEKFIAEVRELESFFNDRHVTLSDSTLGQLAVYVQERESLAYQKGQFEGAKAIGQEMNEIIPKIREDTVREILEIVQRNNSKENILQTMKDYAKLNGININ